MTTLDSNEAIAMLRRAEQRHRRSKRRQTLQRFSLRIQECFFTKPPWVDFDSLKATLRELEAAVRKAHAEELRP